MAAIQAAAPPVKPKEPARVKFPHWYDVVAGLATGFGFGFLLEKSKVYLPPVIIAQMNLSMWLMIKVFLSATAVGMLVYLLLEATGLRARPPPKRSALHIDTLRGLFHGYEGNALGGLLLGVGMTVSGACPGQAFAQLGAGVPSAVWTLAGGLAATLSFGFVMHGLARVLGHDGHERLHATHDGVRVDKHFNIPFWVLAVGFAVMVAGLTLVLERFFPWQDEVRPFLLATSQQPAASSLADYLRLPVWSPSWAGACIGALQLLAIGLCGTALGSSSCYVTASGLALSGAMGSLERLSAYAPYYARHFERSNWWQLAMGLANIAGAYCSVAMSGVRLSPLAVAAMPGPLRAFVGGFLLLLGARIADGCPSGHGLSGMARLNAAGFISVAGMFAGGISTALIMSAVGL